VVSVGTRRSAVATTCALVLAHALATVAPARAAVVVDSSDPRCASLPGPFPPALDAIRAHEPGLEVLVTSEQPAIAIPVASWTRPPTRTSGGALSDLRVAIANAACPGSGRTPRVDGATVVDESLALLTTSSCEGVAFVDPLAGALRAATVSTPASFAAGIFPNLPAPGASASRVALSTRMCVAPPPGALDSKGAPVANGCRPGEPSYYTSFTSGAAVAAGRLFVSSSNLGAGAGTLAPQFLPGTVLVFDLARAPLAAAPHPTTPAIFTTAFNPTHVTPYTTPSGRELLLVGGSGALGLRSDDPATPYREAGGVALGEAAIDVIDAEQLRLVATVPLGLAGLAFERLGIDPSGRVALIGSAIARHVYGIDLAPIDALAPDAPFVRLDGIDGPAAAIFDADTPLVLPGLANGAPFETCPGYVVGVEWASPRRAYATDFCDGTITVLSAALSGPAPLDPSRIQVHETLPLVAPVGPASVGRPQAPGALRVYAQPGESTQAVVLVGQPEGLVCVVAVPAPDSAARAAAAFLALSGLAARAQHGRRRASPEEDVRCSSR